MRSTPSCGHRLCGHRLLQGFIALVFLIAVGGFARAAPGAHGPDGEHLDADHLVEGRASSAPRFEARSETFELVGRLQGGELSMLVNRYESSEPVLDAKVEIESGNTRAVAKFHSDMGDYAVDDAAFLEALSKEGEHALLITIVAGPDSDLLDGKLTVGPADHGHAHDQEEGSGSARTGLLVGGLLLAVVVGGIILRRRGAVRRSAVIGART